MQKESHARGEHVLIGVLILVYAVATAGAIFGVALLDYPLLLAVLSPVGRHLLIAAAATDMVTFVAVLAARRMIDSVIVFYLGRAYGDRSIAWLEKRFARFGRVIHWMVRVFRRAPHVVLLAAPIMPIYALAGSIKLRSLVYLPLVAAAQIGWMSLIYFAGDALSGWINPVVDFLRAHVIEVILLSVCAFLWVRVRFRPAPGAVEEPDRR